MINYTNDKRNSNDKAKVDEMIRLSLVQLLFKQKKKKIDKRIIKNLFRKEES